MKPLIVLNPNSQGGKTGKCADELQGVIQRYVGDADMSFTERPRHAVEIAEQAARDGRDSIIAVGGDGTIHEVANGLMQARADGVAPPPLGIVGQGTGGDFRRCLDLEHRLDQYCKVIAGKKTRSIDIGRFSFRNNVGEEDQAYFVNILSVGLGGLVDRYVADASRALGGTLAYLGATLKALNKSEIGILDCKVFNGEEHESIELHTRQVAICNGRFFGSGMEVAPMAKPDDGLLNVVSMGDSPRIKFLVKSLSIYSGKHLDNPGVEVFSCDRIDIELRNDSIRDEFPLDVDGEPLGTLPISIELVPKALDVYVA